MRFCRHVAPPAVVAGIVLAIPSVALGMTRAGVGAEAVSITAAPAFTAAELDATPGADWIANGGSVNNQRYSSLNQITASNVSGLKEAWHIHLNGSGVASKYSAEATPLVYKGVMYIATGNDDAFALDATTGQQLWEYQSHIDQTINTACCGWDNRGLGLGGGLVFNAQLDGNLVALDQMTGGVVWKVPVFNWKEGVTLTSAPLYYNGVVYVGSTGGEYGFRGSITAYNATNGNYLWRFFTVPQPGDIGGQTWAPGPLGFATGGATVWNNAVGRSLPEHARLHDGQRGSVGKPGSGREPLHLVLRRAERDNRPAQVVVPGRPPRHLGLRLSVADGPVRRLDQRHDAQRRSRSRARTAGSTSSIATTGRR